MQKQSLFRRQQVCIAFAFLGAAACVGTVAGCASDGSVNAPTQSKLVIACDKAQGAITIAGFFQDKMTPDESLAYKAASDVETQFCSPSALASDATPAALSANIAALGKVVTDMQAISDKPAATVANPT